MKVSIRLATVDDVSALARLHVETFRETHGRGPSVAMRDRWPGQINPHPDGWSVQTTDLGWL
ncbi:MAG TPA: hypothetical protein PLX06_01400 [Fimbriimonadaceae bacterium]|nr:hypothetical protein [Fimbriimonadaceae bacterium]